MFRSPGSLGLLLFLVTMEVVAQEKAPAPGGGAAGVVSKADSLQKKLGGMGLDVGGGPKLNLGLPGGKGKTETLSSLFGETIPDLGLKVAEFKNRRAEKKKKKKAARLARVQYKGILMDEASVKYGSGERANIEMFHVLKEYQPIDPYVRGPQTRWYDTKKRIVSSAVVKDKATARPLHGPYRRYVAGTLVEEGFYYRGVMDGRWVKYDTKYNLLDKSLWNKGFPADARITYYDSAHSKIKEVIPVQLGSVEGEYLAYYDGGQLMEVGRYERGKKIGRWFEYYQYRSQRKRETQYPRSCWDDETEPFVVKEWDEKGKLLYDHSKDQRAQATEAPAETEN